MSDSFGNFSEIANNFVGHLESSYPYYYTTLANLQLDIVGFLAVLGEGSVLANAQVSTLSRLIFIPRLLPAPQALLRPSRPSKLESEVGTVTGVHSGNKRDYVNAIGHLVLDAEKMPEYSVRCVKIKRLSDGTVKNRRVSTQSLLAVFGCIQSVLLLALAVVYRDGMAILAVGLLSLLSTLVGVGNKWRLRLHKRNLQGPVPEGDVVIRYPKGNFLVVQCAEEVARELYFAPEAIHYLVTRPSVYRLISLVGTMMIMFGVICLANAQIQLQLAFAGAYISLNAAYWLVAALPSKMNWDMSCFCIEKQQFAKSKLLDAAKWAKKGEDEEPPRAREMDPKTFADYNPTFTWALWRAIATTKKIGWVAHSNATPDSPAWRHWIQEAQAEAQATTYDEATGMWTISDWDPQVALTKLLENRDFVGEASSVRTESDAVLGAEKC
ncbi:hypothetical protein E2P81_ATG01158 [Venturia nashicola]|nr:hypothetical protein E2P81_ATG01158 [Venturia nashicola]